jgi:hypothetical protein
VEKITYNSQNVNDIGLIIDNKIKSLFYDYLSDEDECTIVNTDLSNGEEVSYGNTYSYFKKGERTYFTSMVDVEYRKRCYDEYDKIIGNKFECQIVDKYTYSIKYYEYADKISEVGIYQALNQIEKISKIDIEVLNISKKDILDEYERISVFINKPEAMKYIKDNIDELFKTYGFAQGSGGINRLYQTKGLVFYDYISVYKILPIYTSIYRDLAQLYISIIKDDGKTKLLSRWCEMKKINYGLVKHLSLFEDESFEGGEVI